MFAIEVECPLSIINSTNSFLFLLIAYIGKFSELRLQTLTGVSKVSDVKLLPGYIGINLNLKPIADDGEFVNHICPGILVEGGGTSGRGKIGKRDVYGFPLVSCIR